MKTTIIGVNNHGVDNIHYLPPQLVINNHRVIFHQDPTTEYIGGTSYSNFDYYIDFSLFHEDKYLTLLLGDAYVPVIREPKSLQALRLMPANIPNLIVPRVYATMGRRHYAAGITKIGQPNGTRVVVKRENGAWGNDQVLIYTHHLDALLRIYKEHTVEELMELFPTAIFTGAHSDIEDQTAFGNDSLVVTEYIENITHEYRVLVGGKYRGVKERAIREGDYPQANLDLDVPREASPAKLQSLDTFFTDDEVETIESIVHSLNITLGSIDIFRTKEGIGFFEWSPQFGTQTNCPHQMRELHIDFIKSVIGI